MLEDGLNLLKLIKHLKTLSQMNSLSNVATNSKIVVSKWNSKDQLYIESLIVIRSDSKLLVKFVKNAKHVVKTRTQKVGWYIRIYCDLLTNEECYIYINLKSSFASNAVRSFLDLLHNSDDIPLYNDTCLNEEIPAPMFPLNRQSLIKHFTDYHVLCLKNQKSVQKPKPKPSIGAKLLNSADASGIVESYHDLSKSFCDILTYCHEKGIIDEFDDLDDDDDDDSLSVE